MVKGQAVDDKHIDGDTIKFIAMFKALNSNQAEIYKRIKDSKLSHNQILAFINDECSVDQLSHFPERIPNVQRTNRKVKLRTLTPDEDKPKEEEEEWNERDGMSNSILSNFSEKG